MAHIVDTIREWQDRLWPAICLVESGGKSDAIGDAGLAVGIAQIHKVCVDDCNRIMGHGEAAAYTYEDRLNPKKSRAMFEIYTEYWGVRCADEKARRSKNGLSDSLLFASPEFCMGDLARIWNGGPSGWQWESTKEYEAKVIDKLEELENGKTKQP